MEATTCPECTNDVTETDTTCPRCGASLVADDPVAPPLMSVVKEAQPPASGVPVIATRAAAVAFIGWLGVLAVQAWRAYADGYIDTLLPAWNTVVAFAMMPIAVGVFQRRLWAQRWVFASATLTALSTAMTASKSDSMLLWVGALLLGGVAVVMAKTKEIFRYDNAHRGTLAQVIATVALVGSIFVYMNAQTSRGTERGRKAFAAEMQTWYAKGGAAAVRVYIQGRTLVIESAVDSDEQIDAAASELHYTIVKHGNRARPWALGFDAIRVTNGTHEQRLAPPDPP